MDLDICCLPGEGERGERRMRGWPDNYQYWPKFLPFPTEIKRPRGWVPNRQSIDWPQSQFAPLWLPPGSPSFQPYRYGPDGPLVNFRPTYRVHGIRGLPAGSAHRHSMVGPDGDINRLPPSYGGEIMPYYSRARFNPEEVDDVVVDELLDTPVEVAPTEEVVPESAEEPAEEAAVDETSFVPYEPELLEGLSDRMVSRLQKLETILTKLDAAELGPVAQRVHDNLLKAHERIRGRLEKHIEDRDQITGRRKGAIKRRIRLLRARRKVKQARKAAGTMKRKVSKAHKVNQIRRGYQQGKVTRGQAKYLVKATLHGVKPQASRAAAAAAGGRRYVPAHRRRVSRDMRRVSRGR